jgi:predicted amidohydrolase
MTLKIATIQLPAEKFGVTTIREGLQCADDEGVDIICFPEGYLNGYTRDERHARGVAIDLSSQKFSEMLTDLKGFTTWAIIGVIEIEDGKLFNTAIVVHKGKLLGKYRKTHPQEGIFKAGTEYPVFDIKGHKFGINICYDANFPEASQKLAEQGAEIIFFPLNNVLPVASAEKWRHKHVENLIQRACETGAWVVSSDVTTRHDESTGYGCSAIVSPAGEVIEKIQELQQGFVATILQ